MTDEEALRAAVERRAEALAAAVGGHAGALHVPCRYRGAERATLVSR